MVFIYGCTVKPLKYNVFQNFLLMFDGPAMAEITVQFNTRKHCHGSLWRPGYSNSPPNVLTCFGHESGFLVVP